MPLCRRCGRLIHAHRARHAGGHRRLQIGESRPSDYSPGASKSVPAASSRQDVLTVHGQDTKGKVVLGFRVYGLEVI